MTRPIDSRTVPNERGGELTFRMQFRTSIILLALLVPTTSPARNKPEVRGKVLGACATFAADGTSAAVTFDATRVSLEITDPSGKSSHLSLPLRHTTQITNRSLYPGSPNTCDAYFDREGDLVAIGIDNLQIGVADVKAMQWVGDWGVEADAGIASPSLAGFLAGTTSLVVVGEPPAEGGKGIHWGLYATALFDPSGKQLMPLHIQRYGEDGDLFRRFADARHNRLWVFRCEPVDAPMSRQPLCPIASTSLTGNEPSLPEFVPSMQGRKRTDLWFYPSAFVVPDPNMIVFGEGTTFWAVNMASQIIHRFALPRRPHFPSFEEMDGRTALAPDAQVVAVAVNRSRLAFPFLVDNYVFQGTDIAVIQIDPLRLLGVLQYGRTAYAPGFAIDHREGRVTALVYRRDRWERDEMTAAPHP